MTTVKIFIAAVFSAVLSINSFAQCTGHSNHDHSEMTSVKTETFKVLGSCDMCKTRIEKAALVQGVSKADWNSESKMLTIVYDASIVKNDDIQKKIASAGHDTEKNKAEEKAYNSLPGCCKYDRKFN